MIRSVSERLEYLRGLLQKKEDIKRLLTEQGQLTEELEKEIEKAETVTRLDDIYLPFRPKKRTRGTIAREKGLELRFETDPAIPRRVLGDANFWKVLGHYVRKHRTNTVETRPLTVETRHPRFL